MADRITEETEKRFNSPAYKRSRFAYIARSASAYFATILMQDAFLAKVLTEVGMSDSTIGIISSVETVSVLFQLLTLLLVTRMKSVKRTVVLYDLLSILLMGMTFLVPFLNVPRAVKTLLVFVFVGGGFLFKNIIASLLYKWGLSFVNPGKRGLFSAKNEMVSLSTGVVFTLSMGFAMDYFEEQGRLRDGFLLLALSMMVLWIASFVFNLLMQKTERREETRQKKSFREVMRNTFGNRKYVSMLLLQLMVQLGICLTSSFLGTYKINELMFSVGTVQLINICGVLARFLISRPFGRYSDRCSYARGYSLGLLFTAAGVACVIFTSPSARWLIIPFTVLFNASFAGTSANSTNMLFNVVDPDYFVQAAAMKSGILGVCGFLASLLGSRILGAIQAAGNTVFGIRGIYGQQFLAFLSTLILIGAYLFSRSFAGGKTEAAAP